jgi:outer membrane protein assembly factor BamD (BamD/ComL family)
MLALSQAGDFIRGLGILLSVVVFLLWLCWLMLKRSRDPQPLLVRFLITPLILGSGYWFIKKLAGGGDAIGQIAGVLAGAVFGLILAVIWVPVIASGVSEWIGSLFTGGSEPPPPEPHYSVAETRIKQGRYREAIYEIQNELEKFPTDVTGHMKLAEVQAKYLDDLPAAQTTLERFINQPGHPPAHIAYALNAIADWQLKLHDVDAARATLERLAALLPNTEQANLAAQRLAHLASKEQLLASHEHRPMTLRPGRTDVGLEKNAAPLSPIQETPADEAQRLAHHLEQHPLDNEARERLANLYASHYQRLDLALAQLEELINAPNQPGKEVARWLNTAADLQLQHGADYDAVRATLERIIEKFPGLAASELARQRLEHLRLEFKGKEQARVVHLGAYEKDLGLKRKPPG